MTSAAPPASPPAPPPAAPPVTSSPSLQAFRPLPRTGVVFVTAEAVARGYRAGHPDWCNLGQGQPETGPLPGAPPRIGELTIDPSDHEYAPVGGLWELREAVASLYNHLYRRGLLSQYAAENVAISGGGRAALTRAVAALDQVNLGHFLPDYTAYEELLEIFRRVSPIPILLSREQAYRFTVEDLRREVLGRGLSALLMSNPCNPMGKLISGQDLARWVELGRELDCSLLIDEFYSQYVWNLGPGEPGPQVSAARYVEDVDADPVVIVDGLTKNWRYPGWRITWTLGPRRVIEAVESAGSFLDGGGSKPLQRAAIQLMEPRHVFAEGEAIRQAFSLKRQLMLRRVRELGMVLDREPDGTFYAFVSMRDLPEPIADGMAFFRAALDHRVITVPGVFFDVNPGHRRAQRLSRFHQHARLSFGPSLDEVSRGLDRLGEMIRAFAAA
ncbi:MAG TPA: pyridoxal phosphate-dependent aminotransferase [Thermoanaerobaculia bacterium]|nr:pyridoxal phosphate-dependent aminotransferase [Thermoanaerobaculia bacterium]